MHLATIYHMNQEENQERDAREERHTVSQRDIRDIKYQVDKLSGVVGGLSGDVIKLIESFTGDDLGKAGILADVKRISANQALLETKIELLEKKLDTLQGVAKVNQKYILRFVAAAAAIIGAFAKSIIDHFFKK